jgi:dihydroneopterin aldolase
MSNERFYLLEYLKHDLAKVHLSHWCFQNKTNLKIEKAFTSINNKQDEQHFFQQISFS